MSRFVTAAKARRMSKAGVPVPHHLPLTHSSHTSTTVREQHHSSGSLSPNTGLTKLRKNMSIL
ncbi:hypothetical protein E2C01_090265 [Portunus trituberculatus]|uniref:Uncharacterized protein n=1 Tax=Portunus trituberculatus TaxID=210409 RepID=A0A5B7JE86_PORTR|nr:hypothetical protein [Portunus trituberculatus]